MTVEDHGTTETGNASRRALLLGAGAVGATTVLTACASDDSSTSGTGAPGPPADPPPPPPPPAGNGEKDAGGAGGIAKTSEIKVGGGKIFADDGVVITQPTKGEFKAFSNVCTHQGCPVAEVAGGTINCTCHGSKFSIEDGSVKGGPAKKGLAEKEITVEGKNITLA
jgi:Rieske Fe-S protein